MQRDVQGWEMERPLIKSAQPYEAWEQAAKELIEIEMVKRDMGGFKPEVQHLLPSKVRRCHHLVRPRPISNFSPKSASPLPA